MEIYTDNSKVIEGLEARIAELEHYNLGLANESCAQQAKITELEERNAELEDFASMIIDVEPADTKELYFMYQEWVRKAKALKENGND